MSRVIGLCGGSCSGKTTLTTLLASRLGTEASVLSLDDYYLSTGGRVVSTYESPELYRMEDFTSDLRALKAGRSVVITSGSRESISSGILEKIIHAAPIIVVEGFLLYATDATTRLFDEKVYLDLPEEIMVERRLARRVKTTGSDSDDYIQHGLRRGYRDFVLPQRKLASVILDATKSPVELVAAITSLLQPT